MNLNISIKSIGYNVGTIGYLKTGLQNGSLRLEEGKLKSNGNHGLWLKGEQTQFLAAFNQYGLRPSDCAAAIRYDVADDQDREATWTDAAWETLMEIAQKWCDEKNEARENDAEASAETVAA